MRLVLLRHAIAEDREIYSKKNKDDEKRPLTKKGIRTFKKNARAIKKLFPKIKIIFTSPLTRAKQTAEILAKHYSTELITTKSLKPDSSLVDFKKMLVKNFSPTDIVVVGHEPFLSQFVGMAVCDSKKSIVKMKKGGICVLKITDKKLSMVQIYSLLTPRDLSNIAK